MAAERYTHKLTGCAPVPLASYLKALGILRLVSEQKADPNVQGWWEGDSFHLKTTLSKESLLQFFTEKYSPTAIVAPWNGGSGFFPKDNKSSIDAITAGNANRLQTYRDTIVACKTVLKQMGLTEKPDGETKGELLIECRGQLPDEALSCLDAAYVLTEAGPKYPPLLGTGLNDGRLEFSNNFMQRLLDLIDPQNGDATSKSARWLKESLFPDVQDELQRDSILGQFDPGAVERPVNPWDFVLMLEGALVFAAAAVKRHETATKGTLSYPFSVRAAGVGYGSSSASDEESSRAEMWLPLWSHPSSFLELQILMAEGRVQVNGRAARNGIDFARAIATLGIDRGITNFVRFGFHARNGLAYFAVPLGRFRVAPQPQVDLLSQIDSWLDSFRRAASSDAAPASAGRILRQLEGAILELCKSKGIKQLQAVLIALGNAQNILSVSRKWSDENYQRPVPPLPQDWLIGCDDGSPEFRLAASLAGIDSREVGNFRQYVSAIAFKGRLTDGQNRWSEWNDDPSAQNQVVWGKSSLESNLIAVLQRRSIDAIRDSERVGDNKLVFPSKSIRNASLQDIARFLQEGQIDTEKLEGLLRGLLLIDWDKVEKEPNRNDIVAVDADTIPFSDACYAALKLCYSPYAIRERHVSFDPAIVNLASAGRVSDAYRLAVRRLAGSNLRPAFEAVASTSIPPNRLAASLLFSLSFSDTQRLSESLLTIES